MREQAEKQKKILFYTVFALLLLVIHYFIVTGSNDDAWFAKILDNFKLVDYLIMRYQVWTSRLPIEMAVVFLTRVNPWIWKICNMAIIMLLVYECSSIFGKTDRTMNTGLFMLLFLLLPFNMLNSSGWISTTLNYLWPITIGIFTLIPFCKWEKDATASWWEYVLSFLACCMSCFQEQMVAVLFAIYVLYAGYRIYKKRKLPLFWYMLFIISLVLLLFTLTCPGNANRSVLEMQTWFPEFANLSFAEKLLMGCISTVSYYVSCGEFNTVFLLFLYVLLLAVINSAKKVSLRFIAIYPFLVTFFWGYGGRLVMKYNLTSHIFWLGLIQNDKLSKFGIYGFWPLLLECFVFLTVLCAIVISLLAVFGKTLEFCMTIAILSAALCSRIVLGFSPTVYASGARTAILGCICFVILIFLCVQKSLSFVKTPKYGLCFAPGYLFSLFTTIMINIS